MIPTNKAHAFDKAAKKDVNQIRNIIQHRYGIDLISDQYYSNSNNGNNNDVLPTSYSEMCIKDDYRIELRNAPNINNVFEDVSDWIQQSDSVNKMLRIISKFTLCSDNYLKNL